MLKGLKMKRLISIVMILSMILVFAACNDIPDVTSDTTGGQTTPIYVAKDPVSCVAIGTGLSLEHINSIPEGAINISRQRQKQIK